MKINNNEIELNEHTIIHKIEHSFITLKNGKEVIKKGKTTYTIIDQSEENEPIYIEEWIIRLYFLKSFIFYEKICRKQHKVTINRKKDKKIKAIKCFI